MTNPQTLIFGILVFLTLIYSILVKIFKRKIAHIFAANSLQPTADSEEPETITARKAME